MNSTSSQAQTTRIELLIDGADVPTSSYADVLDPGKTSELVGRVAQGNADSVDQAVKAAHKAFASWGRTDLKTRSELLAKAADALDAAIPEVIELMARESGMLVATNRMEIGGAAAIVRDHIEFGASFLKPLVVEDSASWVSLEKRPIGVIAAIVSWNAPVILTMRKLAPALICGNTLVIKPAPSAPLGISILLKRVAGLFPPGVVNVVHGGADVGKALSTHPLVRKISFTGGGAVAQSIMRDAASTIKDVQFELGGNDPAIVLDDANFADAIPKIVGGAFRRAGQFCFAVKRVYVPETRFEEFFNMMTAEVARLRVGHPLDKTSTMGPLNNKNQYDFVKGLIERTRKSGAEVFELGSKVDADTWNDGYYMLPTVVKNPDPDSEVVVVEQFGPVIPVVAYKTEADAIRMANQTELGLASSVWSASFDRAVAVSRQIESGMTFINQAGTTRLGQKTIPFGGVKQSGIGRENSELGLGEYVEYHGINYHR